MGGSTIFMKAKRSLTSSFDHLLKRKNSRDDFGASSKDVKVLTTKVSLSTNLGGFSTYNAYRFFKQSQDGKISSTSSENSYKKLDGDESESLARPRTGSLDFSGSPKVPVEQLKSPMMDMLVISARVAKYSKRH